MSNATYKSPLYIQLREVIRNKIEDGEYPVGTAIPSESQLAETYNLNPLSVRSALSALKYEGLLRSVQGKGVFVNGSKTERDLETFGGYRQTMDERSIDAHTRVLIKALRPAGPYYSKLLDLAEDDQVWFTRRIDYSNNEPVALEEIYIPEKILPSYGDVDIELFSIYDIFTWNGLRPTDADQTLRVLFLEPSRAKLINLTSEQAVMELSNLTRDEKGQNIEFARNYVRPDKIEINTNNCNEKGLRNNVFPRPFLLSQSITNVPLSLSKMTVLSDDFFTIFDNHIHIIYFDIVDAAQWISIDDEHISTLAFDYASCLVIAAQCFCAV